MTRDDYRAKCIEVMAMASANSGCTFSVWDTLNDISKEEYQREQAAAFDSLRGAGVRVVPVAATEEMILPVVGHECRLTRSMAYEAWRRMSAAGDLTNPTENNP